MSLTTSERHFLFSSNPVMGALNVNSLGNRFSVTFNPPLRFDEKAQQIRMELLESELHILQYSKYNKYEQSYTNFGTK